MTATTTGVSSSQMSSSLDALQDDMNAKELSLYTYAAKASFNQSMAQTLGNLATDAAKSKPEV
jgi:hypothetical protein